MHYLALCCIAKDETPYIREWVAYHTLLGVEHFFIYDNMSDPPISEVLKGYANPDLVTIKRIPGKAKQMDAYEDCLKGAGKNAFWLGLMDLDEFICPLHDNDIRLVLAEFEAYAALGVSWRVFSSNGHLKRPHGPVLKNYTKGLMAKHNYLIKNFVQPSRIEAARNPHFCWYKRGQYAVTENHIPIPTDSHIAPPSYKHIQINHYHYKSQQDYEARLLRGRATTPDPEKNRKIDDFYTHLAWEETDEPSIQRFLPPLELLLKKNALPIPYQPFSHLTEKTPFSEYMNTALELLHNGRYDQASICLCHAAKHYRDQAELWVTRALAARHSGNYARAHVFLHQALTCETLPNVYVEYTRLYLATNDVEKAQATLQYLEQLMHLKSFKDPQWKNMLPILQREIDTAKNK